MSRTSRTVVTSNKAPQLIGAYSLGIAVTSVYVSGQVGVDTGGRLIGKDDAATQTRQAPNNIGAILAAANGNSSDIVEFTTYVIGRESIPGYLQGRSEVYSEFTQMAFSCQHSSSSIRPDSRGFLGRNKSSCSSFINLTKRNNPVNNLASIEGLSA